MYTYSIYCSILLFFLRNEEIHQVIILSNLNISLCLTLLYLCRKNYCPKFSIFYNCQLTIIIQACKRRIKTIDAHKSITRESQCQHQLLFIFSIICWHQFQVRKYIHSPLTAKANTKIFNCFRVVWIAENICCGLSSALACQI